MALMHHLPSYLSRGPGADRCTYAPDVPLNEHERAVLDTACAAVPPPAVVPAVGTDSDYPDYVSNLLLTVLDLQLHNKIVDLLRYLDKSTYPEAGIIPISRGGGSGNSWWRRLVDGGSVRTVGIIP